MAIAFFRIKFSSSRSLIFFFICRSSSSAGCSLPLPGNASDLLFAPLGRELGGFSEWIFEVDPFIIAGELEQPQNIRWDIVRQMALYMVIIGQIDNLNRVEHIQQYTGCWAV